MESYQDKTPPPQPIEEVIQQWQLLYNYQLNDLKELEQMKKDFIETKKQITKGVQSRKLKMMKDLESQIDARSFLLRTKDETIVAGYNGMKQELIIKELVA